MSNLTSSGTTAGSIEGAGNYRLGGKLLTAGTNNSPPSLRRDIRRRPWRRHWRRADQSRHGYADPVRRQTYTGGTTISAGTLQMALAGPPARSPETSNNATLAFNHLDGVTFGGTISGAGGVQQIGTGSTTFTADNTYTGGTTIAAGALGARCAAPPAKSSATWPTAGCSGSTAPMRLRSTAYFRHRLDPAVRQRHQILTGANTYSAVR